MILAFIFIFGLVIGSFLNVCIYRLPRGENLAYPSSHCTQCNSEIKRYDLIPVLSYIFLKGRCRSCKASISIRYPLLELITGVLFGALYIKYNLSADFYKFALLFCFLIVIAMIDYDTTDIYAVTTYPAIALGIVFVIISYFTKGEFLTYIYGGALSAGVIAIIILTTQGMGWGDCELCGMLGLFLGFRASILMLFLSFVMGGTVGIILMITGKKKKKDYIPLGPFIALAGIITALWGNEIILWYMQRILGI